MSEKTQPILDWLSSPNGQVAISAVAGAAVNAVFEWKGVYATTRKMFIGSTSAYFLAPVGVPMVQKSLAWFSVPETSSASVGGFIIGVTGVFLIEVIIIAVRSRFKTLRRDGDSNEEG